MEKTGKETKEIRRYAFKLALALTLVAIIVSFVSSIVSISFSTRQQQKETEYKLVKLSETIEQIKNKEIQNELKVKELEEESQQLSKQINLILKNVTKQLELIQKMSIERMREEEKDMKRGQK